MSESIFPAKLPLEDWIQFAVEWMVANWRPFFQGVRWPIAETLDGLEDLLQATPFWLFIAVLAVLAWRSAGWRVALFSAASMVLIAWIDLWEQAMTTLAIVFTAVLFCLVVGIPLGIWAAGSNRAWSILRPILDFMQTTPSFVYLVPVVMLFGVGTVPGVIATIIFSVSPIIRLTNLGIRQVQPDVVEAGLAFGSTRLQLLREIQLPLALPTVMAGINQTLLLAMVMGAIASMIGAEGLGLTVLRGIGRLDVGLAAVGGLGIVLLAITFDRITQGLGSSAKTHGRTSGPGFVNRLRAAIFGKPRLKLDSNRDRGDN